MNTRLCKWLVSFATIFCLIIFTSTVNADKPDRPGKPPKPDETTAECIIFTGALMGKAVVEGGCCSDAGPFPEYDMTLNLKDENGDTAYDPGPYHGQLFMNYFGVGRNHGYQVQFWTWDRDDTESPYPDDICFEAIGGVIDNDKKSKILTVSFESEKAYFCEEEEDEAGDKIFEIFPVVSFDLIRTSDLNLCDE